MNSILPTLYTASTWIIPVLFAVTLHEVSHGWTAYFLGDSTAKNARRLSLNPIRHIDRFGTIILPAILLILRVGFVFGYAKPVPVNPHNLRSPKFGMIWVALAGPACNIAQAIAACLLLHLVLLGSGSIVYWMRLNLENALVINVLLAVFNMIPLPPLDGSKVLAGISPRPIYRLLNRMERFGLIIVIALFMLSSWATSFLSLDQNPLFTIIAVPSEWLIQEILKFTGHSA